jgi:hypothetical protein
VPRKTLAQCIRLLAVIGLLITVSLPSQPIAAQDPNDQNIPTTAEVGGSGAGAPMYIECKWEIADMSPGDVPITYGSPIPNDETPSQLQTLADGGTTAGAPCAPSVAQNALNHKRHSIGFRANPDDQPITRQYQKWVAVESTSIAQIADVFFKVWEPYVPLPPNGPNCPNPVTFATDPTGLNTVQYCFKYQHHATSTLGPPTASNPLLKHTCADLQGAALAPMWQQAINTGQMTAAERDSIFTRCNQTEKAVFHVTETVSKDQPCGEYRVEVTVVNASGTPFRLVNFFDVLCFVHLVTDFSTVNWGLIQNGFPANVSGDFVFGSGGPTVRNIGNTPLYLAAHYDPLIFQPDPTKSITKFDLKFRAQHNTDPSSLTTVDPILASQWYCFDLQPVGSNQNGKLDLSVHPEAAQAGIYTGNLDLLGLATCNTPPHQPGGPYSIGGS